ncbi:ribonuclease HI family protein [Sinomonas atrocyanea]|uniref:ribonuclease HI family protein n=1 Tax=Sinomonas atrocyanea TaxID=37927 RepID=UPI002788E8C7|nr:ribonuclease HI family protein [Sinomonas atrocyanea]MDQ0261302.1 ribonuclease HI [Sinomonas atrocyanea]MDR6623002.1 ribonuclease HI [Sinomonas atrocyanea]
MTITAAADGSALGNPGPAGWAWYIDEETWHAGGWPHGTNNQGELMAVLDLFRSTAALGQEPLRILCDSQYVINCVTKWMPGWKRRGWKKADGKPVLNVDLLSQIDAELTGRNYTFEWVKGHAGHPLNEAADTKARAVALAYQSGRAPVEGPGFGGSGGTTSATAPSSSAPSATAPSATAPSATAARQRPADRSAPLGGAGASQRGPGEGPEQAGLFDEPVPEPGQAERARDVEAVVELEQELLDPDVRGDYGQLAFLLHPEYREIGASGRLWGREELIEELVADPGAQARFELVDAVPLGSDVLQVVYRTVNGTGSALRSSLWQRTDGRWRLRFHQGTSEG